MAAFFSLRRSPKPLDLAPGWPIRYRAVQAVYQRPDGRENTGAELLSRSLLEALTTGPY